MRVSSPWRAPFYKDGMAAVSSESGRKPTQQQGRGYLAGLPLSLVGGIRKATSEVNNHPR
jgi:hypothetical protein